jgi:hypothetical protein
MCGGHLRRERVRESGFELGSAGTSFNGPEEDEKRVGWMGEPVGI